MVTDTLLRPSPVRDGPIPVSAYVRDEDGQPTGELILWIEDGYLAALEYAWFTEIPPTALPDPMTVVVSAIA